MTFVISQLLGARTPGAALVGPLLEVLAEYNEVLARGCGLI